MLNQALNEIQTALDVLGQTVHPEQTEAEQCEQLEKVQINLEQTLTFLQNLEKSLKTDKLKVVSAEMDESLNSSDYYQEDWRKTA
jgi:hypothetical protein